MKREVQRREDGGEDKKNGVRRRRRRRQGEGVDAIVATAHSAGDAAPNKDISGQSMDRPEPSIPHTER